MRMEAESNGMHVQEAELPVIGPTCFKNLRFVGKFVKIVLNSCPKVQNLTFIA